MTRLFTALKTALLLTLSASIQAQELRLITLTPALTESVKALGRGDWLVATDQASDAGLPIVGDYQRINIEAIVGLNPTHVLAWEDSTPSDLAAKLDAFGIQLWVSQTQTLDQIAAGLVELGELVSAPPKHAAQFGQALKAIGVRYQDRAPVTAVWLVWDQPLMVVGGRGYQADALRLCGAVSPYSDLPLAAATVAPESLIGSGAQLLIASDRAQYRRFEDWHNIPAIARDQWFQPTGDALTKPGPGLVSGIQALCDAVDNARKAL
ncbi:helical backbone metal receptor [Litorivicinus lipolyticus]|uniref:helical backbone metal receptor n=1 Tax=Litorivicinus lipolyticus TaxID=418701 RepID=UPI003B5CEE0F